MSLFSTKNMSIRKKFMLPSLIYGLGIVILGMSVVMIYLNIQNRSTFTTDLTEQKNSLSQLDASLSGINENLIKLLYFDENERDSLILAKAEDLQSIVAKFTLLAVKQELINDISVAKEVGPVVDELRLKTIRIVGLQLTGDKKKAKDLYEREFLIIVEQVRYFVGDTLYGKSEQIDATLKSIKVQEAKFLIVLVFELLATIVVYLFVQKHIVKQLIGPIHDLHSATLVIEKYYAMIDDQQTNGADGNKNNVPIKSGYKEAMSILANIKSQDEIGVLANNFRAMISRIFKRTTELRGANVALLHTQGQLVQTKKLASLGEMSAGLAHELNQPLGVIKICADFSLELMKKEGFDPDSIRNKLTRMSAQVDRASKIINHLKVFSRQGGHEVKATDMNWIIEEAFVLLSESLKLSGIQLEMDLEDDLPPVMCDYIQIEQVITNLITNAQDAMKISEIKLITVRSYRHQDNVCIDVQDSGCGMTKSIAEKIFDPFFTTKAVGEGTGLGMSISYGILKEHRGSLSVTSKTGFGTKFIVSLPIESSLLAVPN